MSSWRIALEVARKDLRLLARDRPALLFQLLVPIVVITIVAGSLGSPDPRPALPVVDEDGGPVAEMLVQLLAEHAEVSRASREEAELRVARDGTAAAALLLPSGLSRRYLAGRPSSLLLLTDPAKGEEVAMLKAILLRVDKEAVNLADPLAEELLELEERSLTSTRLSTTSAEQNVPGFAVMFVLMGVLFGLAFGLQDERDAGTEARLRLAPGPWSAVLGGKLLARFLVGWLQMAILFAWGRAVFEVPLGTNPLVFPVVAAAVVFALAGFSLLVAAFARTRERIIPLGLTAIMVVCSIGGCWWPLFIEPPWLQALARFTPTAWSMQALTDLILRDRGLPQLAPALGVLLAYGGACGALGMRLLRPR